MRELVARIQDGHLPLLLKRCCVITELVQEDTQRPDVALLVNGLSPVDVYHFRAAILHCGMPLNVIFYQTALGGVGGSWTRRRGRAKVTQLVHLCGAVSGYQDVLDLEIAVQKRRLKVVHAGDTLGDVGEDVQDLGLGQAVLQARVHEIDQAPAGAELHEQEDLVPPSLELRGVRVDVGDDLAVALELLHGLDLSPHVRQRVLVRHGDALEHRRVVLVPRTVGHLDNVDVCEAAFGKVLLDDDAVAAALHLGAGGKGTGGRIVGDGVVGSVEGARAGDGRGVVLRRHWDSEESPAARGEGKAIQGGDMWWQQSRVANSAGRGGRVGGGSWVLQFRV